MSGQMLELLIFAGIAFFVINKLISVLGKTSNEDPSKRSFFGENFKTSLKDVTATDQGQTTILKPKFFQTTKQELKGLIVESNHDEIASGLKEALEKMPKFNISNFMRGAKAAFIMIVEAANQQNNQKLEELVDKRYLDKFKDRNEKYVTIIDNLQESEAHISEIYTFGYNVFIKVIFTSKETSENFKEEWTFSKSAISSDSNWYLNNIETLD